MILDPNKNEAINVNVFFSPLIVPLNEETCWILSHPFGNAESVADFDRFHLSSLARVSGHSLSSPAKKRHAPWNTVIRDIRVSINRGTPIAGWLIREIQLKWMIWGYPHFRKPPYPLSSYLASYLASSLSVRPSVSILSLPM